MKRRHKFARARARSLDRPITNEMKEIKISDHFFEKIERFIAEEPELGYLDVEEFIRDALRHFLVKYRRSDTSSAVPEQQR